MKKAIIYTAIVIVVLVLFTVMMRYRTRHKINPDGTMSMPGSWAQELFGGQLFTLLSGK